MIKIYNAWIAQIEKQSIVPIFGDIIIEDKTISQIIKRDPSYPVKVKKEKESYDAQGRVVTIPNINFHDHFYSRLAKGLPIKGSLENFEEVLKNLWWKLDLALDNEMVRASSQMAVLESIRSGVTYIFDHHASPNSIDKSLLTIAETIENMGLRGVFCFETSDRNGEGKVKESIEENIRICGELSNDNVKGMFGLHASFTLKDKTLETISKYVKKNDVGIHIHLCEDIVDRDKSIKLYNELPLQRLEKYGLLNNKSILAHGIHLNKEDYRILLKHNCALVYNLDSNMNNSVGLPQFLKVPPKLTILAGTDGMHANIPRSMKQLFLLYRHQGNSFDKSFNWFQRLYFDQIKFAKKFFPDFTMLREGDRADIIIWDYIPPTPFNKDNFWGHFIYGILERNIKSVIQNGRYLMRDFSLIDIKEESLSEEIASNGKRLKEIFTNL